MRTVQYVVKMVKNGDKALLKGKTINEDDREYVYEDREWAMKISRIKAKRLKIIFPNGTDFKFVVAETINGKFTGK